MNVSVVIPAYNEEKYLRKCLESLTNQDDKPSEIIIVDNNCSDKTIEIAKNFDVKIIREKRQGITFARNAGFDAAKSEIIARTDADAILPPDWISKIKENFKDPSLGGLSGPASYFKKPLTSKISKYIAFNVLRSIGIMFGHPPMFGPNMAIRKSLWKKVKKDICLSDKNVHEDIDLSIHLGKIAKIKLDENFTLRVRRGRWRTLLTEYVARLVRMFASHEIKPRIEFPTS